MRVWRKRELKVLYVVIFLVSAIAPQFLFRARVGTEVTSSGAKKASVGHQMTDMKLKLYKQDRLEWNLNSRTAESFKEGFWNLTDLKGDFIQEDKTKIDFEGNQGDLDLDRRFVNIEGDVKATSTDGYTFETDTLSIRSGNQKDRVFFSNDPVKIYNYGEELEVESVGLMGNIETGVVDLLSDVSCQKSVKKYKDILIQSDHATFKSDLKSIRFTENLSISQANFKIRGEEAYFVYDEENEDLKSVQIDGDILASDGEKTALSDRVEMRTKEDVIIFSGRPRIKVGENEMTGEEILVTNQQKNIQVIKGNIKSTKDGVKLDE